MSDNFIDFYQLLEVSRTASEDEIKQALKNQRRTWQKRQASGDQSKRHLAEEQMRRLDEANKVLLNAEARASYDQQLASWTGPSPGGGDHSMGGAANWLDRAREFLAKGDVQSAAYAAREATTQDGANHEAWAIRGQSSMLLGNTQDAIFEYSEALRIKPNEPEYHFDLGGIYEQASNWNLALSCYERASGLAPANPVYRSSVANLDTVSYNLTAYDATNGSQRWQVDSTFGAAKVAPGSSDSQARFVPIGLSGPAVVGLLEQRVDGDSRVDVLGVNLADGQQLWGHTLGSYEKPDATDIGTDAVMVEDRDGNILMLDAASGAPTPVAIDASDYSSWYLYQLDHDNFVGVVGGQLVGVHRDGSVGWRYPRISGDLIIDYTSGVVIFQDGSSNSTGLLAYDGRAGNQLWGIDRGRMSEVNLSLKQANNGYVVGSARGKTIVFDDRTGTQVIADYQSSIESYGRWIDNKLYVSCGGNSRATSFIADKAPVGISYPSSSSTPQLVFAPSGGTGSGSTVVTIATATETKAPAQYRIVAPGTGCGGPCKVYRRNTPFRKIVDRGTATAIVLNLQNMPGAGIKISEAVRRLFDAGVRMITPSYEGANEFGGGFLEPNVGLTNSGERLLEVCARMGIIIDLSHLGLQTVRDILDFAETQRGLGLKLMASHGGIAELFAGTTDPDMPRNLPLDSLKRLVGVGGWVGIYTLTFGLHQSDDGIGPFLRHLDLAVRELGSSHVGIGSDGVYHELDANAQAAQFEKMRAKLDPTGVKGARSPDTPPSLNTVERLQLIEDDLRLFGFGPQSVIDDILGGSLFRWLADNLAGDVDMT